MPGVEQGGAVARALHPGVFSDLDLARRLERAEADAGACFVEARQRVTPGSRAKWIDVAGTYAMYDGVDSPLTQTFGLGMFGDVTDDELARLEAFFLDRGAPVCHEVSPLAGVALADRLGRRGYRPVEFTSVMFRPLGVSTDRPAANRTLRIRVIAAEEADRWSEVSARGWAEHPELREFLLALGRVTVASERLVALFAELEGVPVATAVLRFHAGVALLAGASTVPEARRRGAQQALLDARIALAAREGCDLLMMCAAPGSASQRNAERQGFRIAYTRTKWMLAGSESRVPHST